MPSSLIDTVLDGAGQATSNPTPVAGGEQAGLVRALAGVPAPRDPRGRRYRLAGVLTVAVCAVLAGATTFTAIADWLADLDGDGRTRVGFAGAVPVASTLWRLLIRIDADALSACLAGWLHARPRRRRRRRGRGRGRARCWRSTASRCAAPAAATAAGCTCWPATPSPPAIVPGQVTVGDKTNEIPLFTTVVDRAAARGSIAGVLVTADALPTPTAHARDLHARGAPLLVTVKANQCATRRSDVSPPQAGGTRREVPGSDG